MLVHKTMPTSCREDLMLDGSKSSSLYSVGKNVPLVTGTNIGIFVSCVNVYTPEAINN